MNDDMNEIYGIWIREHRGDVQVLVETRPGEWRQVFREPLHCFERTSHIVEPSGVRSRPFIDENFEPIEKSHVRQS